MLTADAKARRRNFLGSSDAAGALGLTPVQVPVRVVARKDRATGGGGSWRQPRGHARKRHGAGDPGCGDQSSTTAGGPMEYLGGLEYAAVRVLNNGPLAMTADAVVADRGTPNPYPRRSQIRESPERWGPVSDGLDGLPPGTRRRSSTAVVTGSPRGVRRRLLRWSTSRTASTKSPPAPGCWPPTSTAVEWWQKRVVGDGPAIAGQAL